MKTHNGSKELNDLKHMVDLSLSALHLEVNEQIADDIHKHVMNYVNAIKQELTESQQEVGRLKQLLGKITEYDVDDVWGDPGQILHNIFQIAYKAYITPAAGKNK